MSKRLDAKEFSEKFQKVLDVLEEKLGASTLNKLKNAFFGKATSSVQRYLYLCVVVLVVVFVFFAYKLYKSLTDRERRKEEKRRSRQQKKRK